MNGICFVLLFENREEKTGKIFAQILFSSLYHLLRFSSRSPRRSSVSTSTSLSGSSACFLMIITVVIVDIMNTRIWMAMAMAEC